VIKRVSDFATPFSVVPAASFDRGYARFRPETAVRDMLKERHPEDLQEIGGTL
jgi:hypothetical protein|tara:strand:+ start:72 stop:230 length:159 start_codon:yes stop_codon:yes gene_type:complete